MSNDVIAILISVISTIAVIINLPLVISLSKSWRKLLLSDVLLLNIFASNMLLGLGYSVPLFSHFTNQELMRIDFSCKFIGYYVFLIACVNIGLLQILSFYQYVLIKKPLIGFRIKTRRDYGVFLSVIAWIYGILVPLPPLFGWSSYIAILDGFSCELDFYEDSKSNKSYVVISSVVAYFIPVIIMGICGYHCIFSNRIRKSVLRNPKKILQNKKERRFTWSVFAMFFSFLITWSPYAVICFFIFADIRVNDTLHICCILFAKTSTITCTLVHMISYSGSESLKFKYFRQFKNGLLRKRESNKEVILLVKGTEGNGDAMFSSTRKKSKIRIMENAL